MKQTEKLFISESTIVSELSLCIWKGTISAERYIRVLEWHVLLTSIQREPYLFQKHNGKPHIVSIKKHSFVKEKSLCWTFSELGL